MNKRIRELAKQARKLAADEHTNGDEYKLNINDDSYYVQELIQEKFAELIVRECADQCLTDDCMRILNHMGIKYERTNYTNKTGRNTISNS